MNVLNIARWEWFKLRTRWMPWVLLAVLLFFSQGSVWAVYFDYSGLRATGGVVRVPGDGTGMSHSATTRCGILRRKRRVTRSWVS